MLCCPHFVLVVRSSEGHLHGARELSKSLVVVFLRINISHLRSQPGVGCAYYTWFAEGVFREHKPVDRRFAAWLRQKPIELRSEVELSAGN
jgi:hypothetical protein